MVNTFLTRSVCFRAPEKFNQSQLVLTVTWSTTEAISGFVRSICKADGFLINFGIFFAFSLPWWTGFSRRLMNTTLGSCLLREVSMAVESAAVGSCFCWHAFLWSCLMKLRSTVRGILHHRPQRRNLSSITRPQLSKMVSAFSEFLRSVVKVCIRRVCVYVYMQFLLRLIMYVHGLFVDTRGKLRLYLCVVRLICKGKIWWMGYCNILSC